MDRFSDNKVGAVFSSSMTAEQLTELRVRIDSMNSGPLRAKAELAWENKDYAAAAAWEADSKKPEFAQPV